MSTTLRPITIPKGVPSISSNGHRQISHLDNHKEFLNIMKDVEHLNPSQLKALYDCLNNGSSRYLSGYLFNIAQRIKKLGNTSSEVIQIISKMVPTDPPSDRKAGVTYLDRRADRPLELGSREQIQLAIKFLPLSEIELLNKALENPSTALAGNTLQIYIAIQESLDREGLINSVGLLLTNNRIGNVIKNAPKAGTRSSHKQNPSQNKSNNKYLKLICEFFKPSPVPAKSKISEKKSLMEHLYSFTNSVKEISLAVSVASIAPILVFSSQIKTEAINPHLTPEITQKYTGSGLSSISKSAPEIDAPLITDTHPWKNVRNSAYAGMWAGAIGMLSMLGNGLTRNKLLNKGISVRG